MLALIFIGLSISFPISHTNQIGEEFIDQFSSSDTSRWIQEDGTTTCIGQHCSYSYKKNLQYTTLSNKAPTGTFLEMTMRNDCDGKQCCIPKGICTKYNGSQITSKLLYHYGSFRFFSKIHLLGMSKKMKSGRVCFSLDGKDHDEKSILIAICIAVRSQFWAQLYLDYDGQLWAKAVALNFDPSVDTAVYRIDFQKDYITFWIKGTLVGAVKSSEQSIPDEAVFINAFLLPEDSEKPDFKSQAVELRAHLYRVRYVTWDGEHQDLFVFGRSSSLRFELVLLVIAAFLSLALAIFFASKKNDGAEEDGLDALLLESENESLKRAKH